MGRARSDADRIAASRAQPTKRGDVANARRKWRGRKAGPQWETYLAILGALERGKPLHLDQSRKLRELLSALLDGTDVSRWFFIPRTGRPIVGIPGLYFEIADYIFFDVQLRRTGRRGELPRIIEAVAKSWNLTERQVKRQLVRARARPSIILLNDDPAYRRAFVEHVQKEFFLVRNSRV